MTMFAASARPMFLPRADKAQRWLPLITLSSWGAVGAALLTQHLGGMLPCPWCVLQRLIFLLIGALALLAWALRPARPALLAGGVLLALCGVAAALWQHFVANASASCNLTLADQIMGALGLDRALPEVFAAYASCAEAKAWLLSVPYEFYSLALFTLLGAALAALLVNARRRATAADF